MRLETHLVATPRIRNVALLGAALGVVLLLSGCSSSAKTAGSGTTTSSTGAGQVATTVAQAPTTARTQTGGNGTQSPPSGPPPSVASFVTPDNIDCHNGNSQMFSASWTTTNSVKSTIAIDGGGIYKTYDANASDSLPFNCSSPHTFVVTAYAQDGRTATKSVTLQPRNVQDTTSTTDASTDTTT